MAYYTDIKNLIDQNITTNGQGDITGAILNSTLKAMVDVVGVNSEINIALSALGFAPYIYAQQRCSVSTGVYTADSVYDCTELIEVPTGSTYIYPNLRASSIVCFDKDKQFLGAGATFMMLLPNTQYISLNFLRSYNYDYKTLGIRFFPQLINYSQISNGLQYFILKNVAVNSSSGNFEYFDTLDCTPILKVSENTKYLYINAKYFDITCWDKNGNLLGSIKTNRPLINSRVGYTLVDGTDRISICFLRSDNIDYSTLEIYTDENEYRRRLINNEGIKPGVFLGKAYNPSSGNLENFPNDLDCTNLIQIEKGIDKYFSTIKINQDISSIFQIVCYDSGYNLIGQTTGKSLRLLDNTAFFSVSFWKNKNVDYSKLYIGIDVVNDIVIPTIRAGLKYYLFGDSITYYDSRAWASDPDYYMVAYPSYIRDVIHAVISNEGVAGDSSNSITTRLLAKNLSDAYAVTYMAGTNDLVNNVAIGTLGSLDRNTYIGNLEVGIRYVLQNYPQVKFYFIAPPYAKNKCITPYCEAMQSVAEAYGVPIIRWDLIGGLNIINADYFMFDGVHPNNKGHERFADALIPFLQSF